eukprot:10517427-Alexandrium_andersonii.AAC.1
MFELCCVRSCMFGRYGCTTRRRPRTQHEQRHITHPSGAPGTDSEVVPGAAQFKLRTLDAMLRTA